MRWLVTFVVGCSTKPTTGDTANGSSSDSGGATASASGSTADTGALAVDEDGDGFTTDLDCDDSDPSVYPGAPDRCGDERVTDCDRFTDHGLVTVDGNTTFADLGAALAAASAGSEVLVCGGATGAFEAPVPIRLVGFGSFAPVLQGHGTGPVLTVPSGTEIEHLQIGQNFGSVDRGGGILLLDGSLVLRDVGLWNNYAREGAGIALPNGGSVELLDGTWVSGNIATEGGGGIHAAPGATVTLDDSSSIEGNGGAWGGGVWLEDGAALSGGTITGNWASATGLAYRDGWTPTPTPIGGGGAMVTGAVTITGTTFTYNGAENGGSIAVWQGGDLVLTNATVDGGADQYGGGLLVLEGSAHLEGTSVTNFSTANYGGGAAVLGGTLTGGTIGGYTVVSGAGIMVDGGSITGTTVTGCGGNGAAVEVYDSGMLTDVVVTDNSTDGIYAIPWYGGTVGAVVLDGVTVRNTGHGVGLSAVVGGLWAGIPVTAYNTVLDGDFTYAGSAAAIQVDAPVTWVGGAITSCHYDAPWRLASAVMVWGDGTFSATGVDFGAGATENTPIDLIAVEDVPYYPGPIHEYDWSGSVTTTCTPTGCD